jgi:hypothetical protein
MISPRITERKKHIFNFDMLRDENFEAISNENG